MSAFRGNAQAQHAFPFTAEARPGRREMEPNSRDLAEQGDASDYSSNALTEISQFFKRPRKTITAPTVREILMGERARKPV